ncbi:MAG: hypothetical protein MK165_02240 [Pirellulaceae bacterium]|nr:hypothetical protein [Pirellulaceae bacterium]
MVHREGIVFMPWLIILPLLVFYLEFSTLGLFILFPMKRQCKEFVGGKTGCVHENQHFVGSKTNAVFLPALA